MKSLIKKMIPHALLPVAQRIYHRLFDKPEVVDFSKEQYDSLDALKCTVSYNKYGGYCVPLSSCHRDAVQKILSNDVYEPKTIEYMMDHCDAGDIVHAGTFFGDFLPALAKGVSPHAKVWAFEPNPESYRCARITLEINGISNVVLTNAGLGSKRETLRIRTRDDNGDALGGASQIVTGNPDERTDLEPVQIVAIDDVIGQDRDVSMIQLDVEGHEKNALAGAMHTISRCFPIIIIEAFSGDEFIESEWFDRNILTLGYRKVSTIHSNSVFLHTSHDENGHRRKPAP